MDLSIPLWAAVPAAIASVVTGWFGGIYAIKSKKIDASTALVERLTFLWEAGLAREASAHEQIAALHRALAEETAARIRLEASVAWCRRRCGSVPPPLPEAADLLRSKRATTAAVGGVSLPLSTTTAAAAHSEDA